MNRTVLTGLALVVLVPGLALAQGAGEARGRRARPAPEGQLPSGVRRLDRPAPPPGEMVPEQAIRRLAAAVQGLSKRVERLEKGFGVLVKRLREAHAARPDRGAARGPRAARRGPRGPRREGGSMGSGGFMPRVRQFARGMQGRLGQFYPRMRQAMQRRAMEMRRAMMARRMAGRRGEAGPDARGARRMRTEAPRGPAPKVTDRRAALPQAAPVSPEARKAMAERVAKAREAARRAHAARAAAPDAPAPTDLVRKAQRLAEENAKLRAELQRLQAQMKKLMQAVQQKRRAAEDRRS